MFHLLRIAEKAANSDVNILILGESGAGKEIVARHIHANSPRRDYLFMDINCYAFSDNLLESELFGHEKGAFTGAINKRIGRFEAANGGTLFLDEMGDISLETQVKLLRSIETKQIYRIGKNEPIAVDFRLIAATNKNIEKEIKAGNFREDLFYRISTIAADCKCTDYFYYYGSILVYINDYRNLFVRTSRSQRCRGSACSGFISLCI